MTYAPKTLTDLAHYWGSKGGVNLGIVGDTRHQAARVSYHLGKDALRPGAYSARTARDKRGLTDAASAMDLGKLGGSFTRLRLFSSWLVTQARENKPGTSDIREIIWTPNGKTVYGWSREAGVNSAPIKGYGDSTHLTHTHISFYRDSEHRDKRGLFEPYFGVTPPDTSTGADMPGLRLKLLGTTDTTPLDAFLTAKVKGPGHSIFNVATAAAVQVADGLDLGVVQRADLVGALPGWAQGDPKGVALNYGGEQHFAVIRDITSGPLPAQPTVDCTAAIAKAIAADRAKARVVYS